ncbi:hypothetical protein [Burkholderia cepacia]|uniref:hypothetical protein n=1 Tax=Burkholderia cepacia TaxID=292 RepID=UPI002990777E|nr:hypothetical protein [Burkholderia cepacia]
MNVESKIKDLQLQVAALRSIIVTLLVVDPSDRARDAVRALAEQQDVRLLFSGSPDTPDADVGRHVDSIFEVVQILREAVERQQREQ